MLKFTMENDLPIALAKLNGIKSDKWPGILSRAANETGYYVLNKYKQQLPILFDRPVPFTINSMYLQKASPKNVEAIVRWREFGSKSGISAEKYLKAEVRGGQRSVKRFERALQAAGLMPRGYVAVPTEEAPTDSYGNVPGSLINKILSYLRANPDAQQNRRIQRYKRTPKKFIKGFLKTAAEQGRQRAREEAARKRGQKFFAVSDRGRAGGLMPGIYERENGFGHGSGGTQGFKARIRRIFTFVPQATYKVRFPFEEIGAEAARAKFPSKLDEAITLSMAGK